MSEIPVIAIFDIGKTNKKFFLFDEHYSIVEERSAKFDETVDEDGFPCEDVDALSIWIKETLASAIHDKKYNIKAVNFSAYGASFVHIDENKNIVAPLYNYLKPYSEDITNRFYNLYGSKETIAVQTASPALGNLNSGLQLFLLKHQKPAIYNTIKASLHLPQYVAFLIHGKEYSDVTSLGCHTALWDYNNHAYHDWVIEEGIDKKLAPLFSSTGIVHTQFENKQIACGVGLHDSSAAFIPYIQTVTNPFLLISTGTWCISMNPYNTVPLTIDELQQDCLCYMSYEGKQVKASRLFAGHEHEEMTKAMASYFHVADDYFKAISYNPQWLTDIKTTDECIFDFTIYSNYNQAYHHFIGYLVQQQKRATRLVLQDTPVEKIFVDGGFAQNEIYMHLMAKVFSTYEVYAASVSQASAIGAAMAIHAAWNTSPVPQDIIKFKKY